MNRAPKGGTIGVNGQHYEGGKFLPNNPDHDKVEGSKPRRARKIEVEPGNYIEAPAGFISIYTKIAAVCIFDRETNRVELLAEDHPVWKYSCRATAEMWARAFNRGDRVTMNV